MDTEHLRQSNNRRLLLAILKAEREYYTTQWIILMSHYLLQCEQKYLLSPLSSQAMKKAFRQSWMSVGGPPRIRSWVKCDTNFNTVQNPRLSLLCSGSLSSVWSVSGLVLLLNLNLSISVRPANKSQ